MDGKRKGNWCQTYSGLPFWPIDPKPEDVNIEDIAHSLSMLCRFGGHCLRFYSVAEHSCHLFDIAPQEYKLWALLHDASEAYIVDVPRPLKPYLSEYKNYEISIMNSVCERFGLEKEEPPIVKELDNRILMDEAEQNMKQSVIPWSIRYEKLGITLKFWNPETSKQEFLRRFNSITTQTR